MDAIKVAAWLSIVVFLAHFADAQNLSTTFNPPITVPLQDGMRTNSTSLDLNDPTVAGANATGATPTQVHLTPAGPNAMFVMWATQNYTVGQGALTPLDISQTSSVVKYGLSANSLTLTANGKVETYSQIYNTTGPAIQGGLTALNYTSPYLHSVTIANLTPGTQYFYQVGDGNTSSSVYNFTSLTAPGPTYPQRVIVFADAGASHNTTVTLQHTLQSASAPNVGIAPVALYVGDHSYADTWSANATTALPTGSNSGVNSASYQPVWDLFMRLVEPFASFIPTLTTVGNHEIEEDDAYHVFQSVQARWKVPNATSNSPSYFFYSQEFGPVHAITLTPYADYTTGSPQWNWLYQDLLKVNRTLTPWVLLQWHNPWYTTGGDYKDFEQFRAAVEPLTYQAGVDAVFYGHVHAYERTYPVFNYQLDPCGSNAITVGDAGNTEGLDFLVNQDASTPAYEDVNGTTCQNVTATTRPKYFVPLNPSIDYFSYYERTLTFQANGNSTGVGNPPGYCYNSQPMWSAYREPSFGHGTLDIVNSTHALWQWNRNQDNVAIAADSVWIVRNTTQCMNKMYPQMRSTNGGMMTASS